MLLLSFAGFLSAGSLLLLVILVSLSEVVVEGGLGGGGKAVLADGGGMGARLPGGVVGLLAEELESLVMGAFLPVSRSFIGRLLGLLEDCTGVPRLVMEVPRLLEPWLGVPERLEPCLEVPEPLEPLPEVPLEPPEAFAVTAILKPLPGAPCGGLLSTF